MSAYDAAFKCQPSAVITGTAARDFSSSPMVLIIVDKATKFHVYRSA
jgi:hypothetical protein